jgi:cobalamin biosynthesis Mg chelatase CobN
MYSAFDPNSADSPFVRKTVSEQPEEQPENATVVQSETAPETQPVQAEIQKTEEQPAGQQPAEKAPADDAETTTSGEGTHKKKPGLSTVALTLVFVALVVCWFIQF